MPAPASRWTVREAAASIGASVAAADDAQAERLLGVARNDAREVQRRDLFVALAGTRAHGATFAAQALDRGAAAMLVGNDVPADARAGIPAGLPLIEVADSDGLVAVGRLARAWRRRNEFLVVGITGSTGKTSTKDLLAALVDARRTTVASRANNNNELGVPLTLLAAGPEVDVVICEMGMRGLRQVEYLCDIADPDVGIVTNAQSAHLELLGTEANIVRAKAELVAGLADGGCAIVPLAQPELVEAAASVPASVVWFGNAAHAGDATRGVVVEQVRRADDGIVVTLAWRGGDAPRGFDAPLELALPLFGAHQALNLAAAIAALGVLTGGVEGAAKAAAALRLSGGRGDRHALTGGGVLIDDAYNANPVSMRAALAELLDTPGARHVAVLGGMAELGEQSPRFHRELGEQAAAAGLDELVVVATTPESRAIVEGYESATHTPAVTFASVDEALAHADDWLRAGDIVLVKASNAVGLGALAQALAARAPNGVALTAGGDGA